jgi:hypothetical protein
VRITISVPDVVRLREFPALRHGEDVKLVAEESEQPPFFYEAEPICGEKQYPVQVARNLPHPLKGGAFRSPTLCRTDHSMDHEAGLQTAPVCRDAFEVEINHGGMTKAERCLMKSALGSAQKYISLFTTYTKGKAVAPSGQPCFPPHR